MKNIKFRGQKDYCKEWTYGNLIQFTWADFIVKFGSFEDRQRVIPETVGQFTGLTESYERTESFEPKEIYQHDILEMEYEGKKIICFVEFEICGFILVSNDFEDGYIWITDVEEHEVDEASWIPFSRIIGNIHDNPELIK